MKSETAVETRRTFCRFCHAGCAIDVDVDVAANRVVAADHLSPGQWRLIAVHADEDRSPCRAQEVDRLDARGVSPYRVDDEVDTRLHLVCRRVRSVRAEATPRGPASPSSASTTRFLRSGTRAVTT